ncbi:endonuclease/exonuclease/phosphatase family protein [Streptococcus hyovaginalis]|uniref:endonuclease/exonuclease/phosphatase family protein n=1 Tax=Streptococcus hyovaginalis TaxID=149015 RepID=UPI003B3B2FB9
MKLLTLNTHSWMEEDMETKFRDLVTGILEADYDVICLQEINQLMTSQVIDSPIAYVPLSINPPIHEDNYALRLVEALKEHGRAYYWSWAYNHIGYGRFHEGVAILSKTPIEVKDLLASDTTDPSDYHTRRALLARTEIDGRPLSIVSLHLSWWEKGFEVEWPRLAEALAKESNPLILMGDFNNPTGNKGYQAVVNSGLDVVDSHVVAEEVSGDHSILADIDGWEGNDQAFKVDHAFVAKDFQVASSRVIFDGEKGPVISDHFGLAVTIK